MSNPRDPSTWDPDMKASHDRWRAAGRPNMLEFIANDVSYTARIPELVAQALAQVYLDDDGVAVALDLGAYLAIVDQTKHWPQADRETFHLALREGVPTGVKPPWA